MAIMTHTTRSRFAKYFAELLAKDYDDSPQDEIAEGPLVPLRERYREPEYLPFIQPNKCARPSQCLGKCRIQG
jgi:hypothetical protein